MVFWVIAETDSKILLYARPWLILKGAEIREGFALTRQISTAQTAPGHLLKGSDLMTQPQRRRRRERFATGWLMNVQG